MARIRSVKPEFWHDRRLARQLSRDSRLLYIALWNQADEHARLQGDVRYVKGQCLPYEDDLSFDDVDRLLDELAVAGCVTRYIVDDDPYIYLPKLARHQRLEADKVASRLPGPDESASWSAPSPESRSDESARGADENALLYVAGSREHVAGSREVSAAEPHDADPAPRDDIDRLCAYLADRIEANGSKRPTITAKWRDACRLMLDRDERSEAEILSAIDWSQKHEFWRSNVLSMPKLREKYDQMRLQAQRENGRVNGKQAETDGMFDRAMARAEAKETEL